MTEDEEILLAFLEESRENLDQLDRDLVDLEARPQDPELLSRVFRVVHTLKGTCGFLGFPRLEMLAHAGEDLLGAMRSGSVVLDQDITSTLLDVVDVVRAVLQRIEVAAEEPADDHEGLILQLRARVPSEYVGDEPGAEPEPRPELETASVRSVQPVDGPLAAPLSPGGSESTVRVDVAVLDKLMDLVGELVLARSRIGEIAGSDDDGPLAGPYRDLRVVTGDLQDSVMTARLQPIGTVTGKFHRIARDLAAALGKQVVVQLEGEDVGVDKAVNEALRDPLLHLVRNALDHGIETPAERLEGGKPAAGVLRIRAFHEGGRVQVEVSDDGRGVDAGALLAKAMAAGIVTAEEAPSLSTDEVLDLMFRAGLSTRDEVTSTSGRGVGMDVVRTSLEQVGGSIEVLSTVGEGALFRLNVPLTLAIMPVLVVSSGGGRYAVPQVHLREVTHLPADELGHRVNVVEDAQFLRLRGRLLPLVDLAGRLGVARGRTDGALVIVVVETDNRRFGLVVDDVGDTVDAVVKPLPRLLRAIPVFSGTTILGDGQAALILDVTGLGLSAGVAGAEQVDAEVEGADDSAQSASELLLGTAPDGGRVAFRVVQVRRLESFAPERLERTGDLEVVQYGEQILPLVRVSEHLPERRLVDREQAPAAADQGLASVVCDTSVGPVGFVIASIDDVVAGTAMLQQPPSRRGVEACVVIGDRVVELLDVDVLAAAAGIGRAS